MKKKLNANDQYFFGTPEGAKMISIEMNDYWVSQQQDIALSLIRYAADLSNVLLAVVIASQAANMGSKRRSSAHQPSCILARRTLR